MDDGRGVAHVNAGHIDEGTHHQSDAAASGRLHVTRVDFGAVRHINHIVLSRVG